MGGSKGSPFLLAQLTVGFCLALEPNFHGAPAPGVRICHSHVFLEPPGYGAAFFPPYPGHWPYPDTFPQMAAPSSVEGIQILGTGNLVISDVSVQHLGIYGRAPS